MSSLTKKIENIPRRCQYLCCGYCRRIELLFTLSIPVAINYILMTYSVQGHTEWIHIGTGNKNDIKIFGEHNNSVQWLNSKRNIILGPSKFIKNMQSVYWDLILSNNSNKQMTLGGNQLYITIFKNFHEKPYTMAVQKWKINRTSQRKTNDTFQNIFLREHNNINMRYWGIVNNLNQRYSHNESAKSLEYTHWGPYNQDHNIRIELNPIQSKESFFVLSDEAPYESKKGGKITTWRGVQLDGSYSLIICGRTNGLKIQLNDFGSLK